MIQLTFVNVRYYIDAETGKSHIHRHSVGEEEVEDVLANAGEDRPGAEGSRIAIGKTRAGRQADLREKTYAGKIINSSPGE